MKRFLSLLLTFLLLLCVCSCSGQDPHEAQTNTKTMPLTTETETAALTDIVTTEAVPEETADPQQTDATAVDTAYQTESVTETEAVNPPCGYGSDVTAFNSIREMIAKIDSGDLSMGEQRIFDAYGCDTAQLLELTGIDEGFSESVVEWCGGFNYCINYIKDGQIISFVPYYTDEQLISALSDLDSWQNLQKNDRLQNLVKKEIPTDEGYMYECTFDTAVTSGLRRTYHSFIDSDAIQRIVTNRYDADGNPTSGQIYILDGHVPFSCYVFGFEADMELAKQLGTRHIPTDHTAAENQTTDQIPALLEQHSQNEDQDFGFTFTVKEGYFAKGEQLTLEVTLINQMDSAYTWTGSSSAYHAWVELVCTTTHGIYQILPEPYPMNDDVGTFEVQSGGKRTTSYWFLIPQDAPVGEYALFCSFQKTTAQFDGVFRLD